MADLSDLPGGDLEDELATPAGPWAAYLAGFAPLAFGAVLLQQSAALGLGSLTAPKPGLWPFALSALLIALSLVLLVRRRRFADCEAFTSSSVGVLAGAATIGIFIVLLPLLGFEIPGVVLLGVWLKVLGRESWRVTLLVPVIVTAAFHLLFVELLSVPIPHLIAL